MVDDTYAAELRDKYLRCMKDIKYRVDVIHRLIIKELDVGYVASTAESIALQFRKILEHIALASLVANRDEYAKQRANFRRDWHATRIMETLASVNPKFYPDPTQSVAVDDPVVDYAFKTVDGYLTQDEYVVLYDECSVMLHAANPYADEPPWIASSLVAQVSGWIKS